MAQVSGTVEHAHSSATWSVTWGGGTGPFQNTIVTGSSNEKVKCWNSNTQTPSLIQCLPENHSLGVISCSINCDSTVLAVSSIDGHIRLWGVKPTGDDGDGGAQRVEFRSIGDIDAPSGQIWSIKFNPKIRDMLCSGDFTGHVNFWNVQTGDKVATIDSGNKQFVLTVDFSQDGELVAAGQKDGTVTVFRRGADKWITEMQKSHRMRVRTVCFAGAGADSVLLVGCDDARVHVYAIAGKEFIGALCGHRSWITCLAANPNPKLSHFFVSSSVDGKVKLWNLKDKEKLVKSFDSHKGQVWSVAFNEAGTHFVSTGESGLMQLYHIDEKVASE